MSVTREAVNRLCRYKNLLEKLQSLGFVKVFSDNLADAVGVSSALVRKDFSVFGLAGNKRGGYRVEELVGQMNRILGKDEAQKVIIVGCGKIGTALMNYRGLARERIRIVAGVDVNPAKVAPAAPVPVRDLLEMPELIRREKIRVAILAVPETVAAHVAGTLIAAGIKGILNFAPILLKSTDECIVQNINIALELENLFYHVRFAQKRAPRTAD